MKIFSFSLLLLLAVIGRANTVPTVKIAVNGTDGDVTVPLGSTVTVTGSFTDPDGDVTEHWLEIQNPAGQWSWEGWLTGEPWGGVIQGSGFSGQKSGALQLNEVGMYHVKSTALDSGGLWESSPIYQLVVTGAATVLPTVINPDGSLNLAGYRNYYGAWTGETWSKRLGPTFGELHPSPGPDNRPTHYQPSDNFHNELRDRLGQGADPIIRDGNIPGPNHEYIPMYASGRVVPYQWGPPYPMVSPLANFRVGLPSNATDLNDPDNISPDHSPAVMLTFHRQDWVPIDDIYWSNYQGGDYWSVGGSIAYIADDQNTKCGIIDAQSFAHYNGVFATSPREDGNPGPVDDTPWNPASYWKLYSKSYEFGNPYGAREVGTYPGPYVASPNSVPLGHKAQNPISIYRSPFIVCGESLVVDREGILTSIQMSTTRNPENPGEFPLPLFKFPDGWQPTNVSCSGSNEFVVVSGWNKNNGQGEIAVFAAQGSATGHSLPWYGFANKGTWTGFKLLGYITLPFSTPDFVLAGTDARIPSDPDESKRNLADQSTRDNLRDPSIGNAGTYLSFARKGWIAVTSKQEGKFVMYDFSKYVKYLWDSYLVHDQSAWEAVKAAHDTGGFPPTFAERPDLLPDMILQKDYAKPTCMIAACNMNANPFSGGNYADFYKLLVAEESGTIHAINISSLGDTFNFTKYAEYGPEEWGSFYVGAGGVSNITSMCWSRWDGDNGDGGSNFASRVAGLGVMSPQDTNPSAFNSTLFVNCRADRKVYCVVCRFDISIHAMRSAVYRTFDDSRLVDPVHVSVSDRAYMVHVADFAGKKLHSFQVGSLYADRVVDTDNNNYVIYPGKAYDPDPNNPQEEIGYAGSLSLPGFGWLSNWNNIN